MSRTYWRSLAQIEDRPEYRAALEREFPEGASEWDDPGGRREFLRVMGASLALAGAACTRQPEEKIVPYVKAPEGLVPGRPLFYASAVVDGGGYALGVLVESHEGRPTKIEGNPEHPASLGGSDASSKRHHPRHEGPALHSLVGEAVVEGDGALADVVGHAGCSCPACASAMSAESISFARR